MISESWYWKKPLLDMAARLRKLKAARQLTKRQLVQIERDIFIGFYSVRKLIETITKVTDATKSLKVRIALHPNRKPANWRNNHRIDVLYDMQKTQQETRDLVFISGRIIHSFIFTPCVGENGGLSGILFTSDTDKNLKLYSMDIDQVVEVFERVGSDDPTEIHWRQDPDSGDETLTVR